MPLAAVYKARIIVLSFFTAVGPHPHGYSPLRFAALRSRLVSRDSPVSETTLSEPSTASLGGDDYANVNEPLQIAITKHFRTLNL
jgi:hypothetical protein